jgi:hypothetical protein
VVGTVAVVHRFRCHLHLQCQRLQRALPKSTALVLRSFRLRSTSKGERSRVSTTSSLSLQSMPRKSRLWVTHRNECQLANVATIARLSRDHMAIVAMTSLAVAIWSHDSRAIVAESGLKGERT